MKDITLLQPVLAQVALTFVLLFMMAHARLGAVQSSSVQSGPPGGRPVWPERAGKISNAFHNALEMPMLFYAVIAFAMITNTGDWIMYALAWTYVFFRAAQAAVHTTYNYIPHRFMAFLASNFALMALWVKLGLAVFGSGTPL